MKNILDKLLIHMYVRERHTYVMVLYILMHESFNHFSSSLLTRRLSDNDMEMCFNCKAACLPPLVTPGLIMTGGAIDPYNETKTAIIMTRHDQCKKWKQAFPTKLLLGAGSSIFHSYFLNYCLPIFDKHQNLRSGFLAFISRPCE